MDIEYRPELLNLVSDLTKITPEVIIGYSEKDDCVCISKADANELLAYILKAPKEFFDYKETIGFYEFPEFYGRFKTFKAPIISIDGSQILMHENGGRMGYKLSNVEPLKKGPTVVEFGDPEYEFELSKDSLMSIVKACNLLQADIAYFTCDRQGVSIKLTCDMNSNQTEELDMYEKSFELIEVDEDVTSEEPIKFKIFSDIFEKLPPRRDYILRIAPPGYITVTLKDENMELNIYTGNITED
jgi:hypothetical protein